MSSQKTSSLGVLDPMENMTLVLKETWQRPRSNVPTTSQSGKVKSQMQTFIELQRPPSTSGSVSARSISPTSGNSMRFPGDPSPFSRPTAWGDQVTVHINKKATGLSATRLKIASDSQEELRISELPKENPRLRNGDTWVVSSIFGRNPCGHNL